MVMIVQASNEFDILFLCLTIVVIFFLGYIMVFFLSSCLPSKTHKEKDLGLLTWQINYATFEAR